MKNNLFQLIRRYQVLVALFLWALLLTLPQFQTPFREYGTIIYGPSLVLAGIILAFLMRHGFFSKTLDDDAHSGWFVEHWKKLPDNDRVKWNLIMLCVLFIGACLILSALAR